MPTLVNGEILDDAWIRKEAAQLRDLLRASLTDEDPFAIDLRAGELARNRVIDQVLLRQAARADSAPIAQDAIERALGELRSGSAAILPSAEPDVRDQVETELRIRRLIAKLTAHVKPPKNKEVTEYYRKNRDSFYTPELVHAAHIVKNIDEQTNEEAALQAIHDAQEQLRAGRPFGEVADQLSDCPGRGGDLGAFARGQMVDEFDAVVFAMSAGEVSEVFRTPFGFHIATVLGKEPEGIRDLDEVREEITNRLLAAKRARAVEQFIAGLRAKADIRNRHEARV